jgi:hypothetical protein
LSISEKLFCTACEVTFVDRDEQVLNLLGPDGRVNRTPPNPSQLATDYSQLTVLQIDKGQPL